LYTSIITSSLAFITSSKTNAVFNKVNYYINSVSLDLSRNPVKPYLFTSALSAPATKTNVSDDEDDEDIKKAIELSLKEADSSRARYTSPPKKKPEVKKVENGVEEDDDDLAAAIAASLKDMEISQKSQSQSGFGAERDYKGYDNKSNVTTYESNVTYNPGVNLSYELTSLETENIYQFSELVEQLQYTGGDLMRDRQVQVSPYEGAVRHNKTNWKKQWFNQQHVLLRF
jgi:hepatocyte growth factor-regulated tyrosine kinase substrate